MTKTQIDHARGGTLTRDGKKLQKKRAENLVMERVAEGNLVIMTRKGCPRRLQ
ncbi:MAG: hypothetical protein R2741_03270 [Methanolobus sp.]